jgi:hypothetical protein
MDFSPNHHNKDGIVLPQKFKFPTELSAGNLKIWRQIQKQNCNIIGWLFILSVCHPVFSKSMSMWGEKRRERKEAN